MTRTNVMSVEPCSSVRILTGISEQENRVLITQSTCKHHQSTLNHDQKLLLFLVCKFFTAIQHILLSGIFLKM